MFYTTCFMRMDGTRTGSTLDSARGDVIGMIKKIKYRIEIELYEVQTVEFLRSWCCSMKYIPSVSLFLCSTEL